MNYAVDYTWAINKQGNMLYDYGNSVWLASSGDYRTDVEGMYRFLLVTSIRQLWRSYFQTVFPS